MPRLGRNSRRPRKRDGLQGGVLIVIGAFLLAALAGGAYWIRNTRVATDQSTNCPLEGPASITLVMVDPSDEITGQQSQRIRQTIERLRDTAKLGDRFDFYVLEGDSRDTLAPVLTVCSPGSPEEANRLYENPDMIRKRYEEKFSLVIDQIVDQITTPTERPTSPIMESIRAATVTTFGPVEAGSISLRAILISDLIQNSDFLSQYKEETTFSEFAVSPAWVQLRPDFKSAQVDVLYLFRPQALRGGKSIQSRGHQEFWNAFVTHSGGIVRTFEPI